jgi:hypothetical protein
MMRGGMVSFTVCLTSAVFAAFGAAALPSADSPLPPSEATSTAAATARLSELLGAAFHSHEEGYWRHNDFDRFWAEIVSLLDRGADANVSYQSGSSVWNAAFVGDPRCECAPYGWPGFVTNKCPNPKYFRACEKLDRAKRDARVLVLLQHGVDPNLNVLSDSSKPIGAPICFAAGAGLWAGFDGLVAHGASCATPCNDGSTLLHLAVEDESSKLLCKSLACGARVDGRDRRGRTPLAIAAESGPVRNVAILLDYGADPGASADEATDVVSIARKKKRATVVRLLTRWRTGKDGPATHSACARSAI